MRKIVELLVMVVAAGALSQCASVKPEGANVTEQRAFVDREAAEILRNLEARVPDSKGDIKDCEGYAVFKYSSGKLPVILSGIGGGMGYGLAVDQTDDSRVYMKVQKLNWGLGMGVRESSVVFVFSDRQVFDKFRRGKWDGGASAEATVKANDLGADIGGTASLKKGYKAYTLTDAGVSYGVTYQTRRFSPVPAMNAD